MTVVAIGKQVVIGDLTFDQCQATTADSDANGALNVIDVDFFARLITDSK